MIEYLKKDWKEIGKIKFKKKGHKPVDIVYIRKEVKGGVEIGWYAEIDNDFYGCHATTHDPALADLPMEKRVTDITQVIEQNAKQTLEAIIEKKNAKNS